MVKKNWLERAHDKCREKCNLNCACGPMEILAQAGVGVHREGKLIGFQAGNEGMERVLAMLQMNGADKTLIAKVKQIIGETQEGFLTIL